MPTTDQTPTRAVAPAAADGAAERWVRWPAVALFVALAYGLAWLVAAPLWRDGGLTNPLFAPIGLAMMATPAVAALVVTFVVVRPAHPARFLGLAPLRPVRRLVGFLALGMVAPPLLCLAAALLAAAAGATDLTIADGATTLLLLLPLQSLLVAVAAMGEELGWRGYLLPALRPLGTWPALVISGAVWGAWHAPLILLGYNFGRPELGGVLLMTGFSVLVGVLIGWVRMRSGSLWPCAVAHGATNASVAAVVLVFTSDPSSLSASLLGWYGWVVLAAAIAVLALLGGFRWASTHPGAGARGAQGAGR